ncbi:uncharacterized protein EDB91DRAFT_1249467 [Suillus paluster]|uniref:uncharacterized protein n=1 Tax=Suillus paluster TaxID=48578 RepID=UPI001B8785B4|nr:uncharacterized protein EDB91DRAFT_1249467 [Suillus paluster]KAG1738149.1 hypothetical protein EDB91DRAFT_1249467 [Suillus paluster]
MHPNPKASFIGVVVFQRFVTRRKKLHVSLACDEPSVSVALPNVLSACHANNSLGGEAPPPTSPSSSQLEDHVSLHNPSQDSVDVLHGNFEGGGAEDMSLAQRRPRHQNRRLPQRFRDVLPQPPSTVPAEVRGLLLQSVGCVVSPEDRSGIVHSVFHTPTNIFGLHPSCSFFHWFPQILLHPDIMALIPGGSPTLGAASAAPFPSTQPLASSSQLQPNSKKSRNNQHPQADMQQDWDSGFDRENFADSETHWHDLSLDAGVEMNNWFRALQHALQSAGAGQPMFPSFHDILTTPAQPPAPSQQSRWPLLSQPPHLLTHSQNDDASAMHAFPVHKLSKPPSAVKSIHQQPAPPSKTLHSAQAAPHVIPVHILTYNPAKPWHWPHGMYTVDMAIGFQQMDVPKLCGFYDQEQLFCLIFGDTPFVRVTYHDNRKAWRETELTILETHKQAGHTQDGLWASYLAAWHTALGLDSKKHSGRK